MLQRCWTDMMSSKPMRRHRLSKGHMRTSRLATVIAAARSRCTPGVHRVGGRRNPERRRRSESSWRN